MNMIKSHQDFNEKLYGMDISAYNLFCSSVNLGIASDKEKFTKEI
jgi:hypothetical protein